MHTPRYNITATPQQQQHIQQPATSAATPALPSAGGQRTPNVDTRRETGEKGKGPAPKKASSRPYLSKTERKKQLEDTEKEAADEVAEEEEVD